MASFVDGPTWRRDPALPFQVMDDQIVIVDPGTHQVHLLNHTAARIWTLLAQAHSLRALVATLEEEYEAPARGLLAEVEACLGQMSEKRLCAPQP